MLNQEKIQQTAQKILDDRAGMAAYGFNPKMTESEIVAELFKMYEKLCARINKTKY